MLPVRLPGNRWSPPKEQALYLNSTHFSAKNMKNPVKAIVKHTLAPLPWLALLCLCTTATGADLWTEQQIARQLSEQHPGETLWLDTPGQPTLALHRQTSRRNIEGGVIILHDIGSNPARPGLTNELRTQLPRYGWSTLSVQMPHLKDLDSEPAVASLLEETRPRILAAIRQFKQRNILNLVLIGHGRSANLALGFLVTSDNIDTDISALVAIGLSSQRGSGDWRDAEAMLARSQVPVLDIYAELDRPAVTATQDARLAAAQLAGTRQPEELNLARTPKVKQLARNKTDNLRYRQIMIPSANSQFDAHSGRAIKRIRSWISVYAAGTEIPVE